MKKETKITDMSLLGTFISDSISNGSKVNLTVTGDSMYPLFKSRMDTVVLAMPKKLKKRDIVFFKRENGSYILHRILKIKNGVLTIAGDNEMKKEFPVKENQVIGVVESFTRNGKKYSITEPWYKLYSFIWCLIFPFRPTGLRLLLKLAGMRAKKEKKIQKPQKRRKSNEEKK